MSDAGLLVCETTIGQTKFDINGASMVSRDEVVAHVQRVALMALEGRTV